MGQSVPDGGWSERDCYGRWTFPCDDQIDPNVISMNATLAAGILAGSAGSQIITSGDLPAFFAQLQQWYGSDPTLIESGVSPTDIPVTAPLPTASQFQLN